MKRAMARLASSTTLNFASRGSLARSRPTIDPSIISDEDMAWLLVDAVESCLTGYERTIVFVELGCGESYLAIERRPHRPTVNPDRGAGSDTLNADRLAEWLRR